MKRFTALCLSLVLAFTVVPTNAFAAEATEKEAKAAAAEVSKELDLADFDVDTDSAANQKADAEIIKSHANVDKSFATAKKELSEEKEVVVENKRMLASDNYSDTEYPVLNGDYVYTSLQYAIDCAVDGDTLYLLDDLQYEAAIIMEKDLTIDMNGYYLGGSYSDLMMAIYNSDVTLTNGSIMNVGEGDALVITGNSNVDIYGMGFVTSAEDSGSVLIGEGASASIDTSYFYNGSILDTTGAFVSAVFVNANAYASVTNCEVMFDEGVGIGGYGTVVSENNVIYMDEGYGVVAAEGADFTINGGNYLSRYAAASTGGKVTISEGVFESMYYDVPAITSNGANNGTNIYIASGSVAGPTNWRTTDKDIIAVTKNMAKPGSTKVNLSGSYNKVKATWNKVSGATGYAVYYKKGSNSYKLSKRTTSKSATISGLSAGAKYTVKVVPYKKCEGFYGTINVNGTKYSTASTYTLKKVTLKSFQKSNSKVKVRWNNINGETGYQISKSTKKTGTNIVSTYKTTSGTSKLISATKGKTYYYKVRAYKTVNGNKIFGPWSAVKSYKR